MRTEGDSWDINTSVGSTALFVAAARAIAARRPDALAVDPYAEVFLRAAGAEWAALIDGDTEQVREHPLYSADFGRTFVEFQAARTRYFDDYFEAVTAAGIRQIVMLAAGLDARAYRLPWPDGTVIYELDQPRVLEFKRDALAANGDKARADRRAVAVDLHEDWPTALRDNGFDPAERSAWLLEGLLIYLPAATQDELFATIDALAAPGSRISIEQVSPSDQADTPLARQSDAAKDDWMNLIYDEPRSEVAQWFSERGWDAERTELTDYLRAAGRDVAVLDVGFPLSSVSLVTAVRRG
ncbi:SAM-dependent methyltransferase [Nocardia sp. CA-107356]|uniref:SAM-dependent methyltransferase n=1 Tax=Nocardia sp. CA-107356 TaxID=3239972 RepID=UPI003D8D03B3